MRVKVEKVGKGLHPNEVLVKIETAKGPQELFIDTRSLRHDTIEVGYPITEKDGYYLIELPAETSSGAWRVWVDKKKTLSDALEAAE
jgi:hypothetical protein